MDIFNVYLWPGHSLLELIVNNNNCIRLSGDFKKSLPSSRTGGVGIESAGGDQSSHGTDGPHGPLLTGDQALHVLLLGPGEAHRLAPHGPGYGPPELRLEEK